MEEVWPLTRNSAGSPDAVHHPGQGVSIVDGCLNGEERHTLLGVDRCNLDPGLRDTSSTITDSPDEEALWVERAGANLVSRAGEDAEGLPRGTVLPDLGIGGHRGFLHPDLLQLRRGAAVKN